MHALSNQEVKYRKTLFSNIAVSNENNKSVFGISIINERDLLFRHNIVGVVFVDLEVVKFLIIRKGWYVNMASSTHDDSH